MSDSRFDRHALLPGWDQNRLQRAAVVIMGMGALGNAVAQALALAGVGQLILCDMDRIEASNLSRTPLFRASDVGSYKVEAAAKALAELSPGISIDARPARLEHGVGLAELREASLVLGCLDSRAGRLELSSRCGLVCAPWLDGATGGWSGEVRPFLDPQGVCFACGLDDDARAENDAPRSCAIPLVVSPQAASAPVSLLVGAHMAVLATRYLMGLGVPDTITVLDGVSGVSAAVLRHRDADCPFHVRLPPPRRLAASHRSTVADLTAELGPGRTPLAWRPFRTGARCRHCGHHDTAAGDLTPARCPQCGSTLQLRTNLELDRAPPSATLAELGVPPREILAVRGVVSTDYIELSR